MLRRVQSFVLTPIGRRMIVSLDVYSIWSWFLLPPSIAESDPKGGAQQGPNEVLRFEVSDAENRPLANAGVTIVLWRHENGSREKGAGIKNGRERGRSFPQGPSRKLAVTVEAKG